MALAFFVDVHVHRAITAGLRTRGVDILTAQEDGAAELDDPALLRRAAELNRVLFTQDQDFLREAAVCQAQGVPFAGIVYAHQQHVTIGRCIEDLHLMAVLLTPEEMRSRLEHLPL